MRELLVDSPRCTSFRFSVVLSYALRVVSAKSLVLCQELDGSGLLDVSETVILWSNDSVDQGSRIQKRAQSSNWTRDEKETGIVRK